MIAAVAMAVVSAKAASVDWKVTGTSSEVGYTVFLLAAEPGTYASVSALAEASVGSATIASMGRGQYGAQVTSANTAITSASMANAYLAIIKSADASEFTYVKQDMSARVYDPANQEASSGTFSTSTATILAGTTSSFQTVPEPTSGLLMLLGMAGLALRRKRA